MSRPVSIVLVGVGGYGTTYVNALFRTPDPPAFTVAGVVDPFAQRSPAAEALGKREIPFFANLDAFYRERSAELAVISSPIHLHTPQTCQALSRGSAVLCEKPLGATVQEVRAMIEARDRAGLFVGIGYQWSFSPAIQALKQDILAGRLGRPVRLRTLVLWPRDEAYYRRNTWAGALRDPEGAWILDSPVNNATAHYLHNMFYVLGKAPDRSAMPVEVEAELYRANAIDNYDTGTVRARTEEGTEILFYASHAVSASRGPEFVYEFDAGTVRFPDADGGIVARLADGTTRNYGNPNAESATKLWDAIAAVRQKKNILCGPEAAGAQTLCMNGMQESAGAITRFPADMVRCNTADPGKKITYAEGLGTVLVRAFEGGLLPNELGVPWAVAGQRLDLHHYETFPRNALPLSDARAADGTPPGNLREVP